MATDLVLRQGVDVTDLNVVEVPDKIIEAHPKLSIIVNFQIKDFCICLWDLSIRPVVNFINNLRTNFSYEYCFGSFSLVTCT